MHENGGTRAALVGKHFHVRQSRRIIDSEKDVLKTDSSGFMRAIAGDSVANPIDSNESLRVDMNELTRVIAFVPNHRLTRVQAFEIRNAAFFCNASNSRFATPKRVGNPLICPTLATERNDAILKSRRHFRGDKLGSGCPIGETSFALFPEAIPPTINVADSQAQIGGNRACRLASLKPLYHR